MAVRQQVEDNKLADHKAARMAELEPLVAGHNKAEGEADRMELAVDNLQVAPHMPVEQHMQVAGDIQLVDMVARHKQPERQVAEHMQVLLRAADIQAVLELVQQQEVDCKLVCKFAELVRLLLAELE